MSTALYRDTRAPLRNGQVFTTGQVARICQFSPRTVTKLIDRGTLKGYRIPGGKDRRVTRAALLAFLREHDFPFHTLDAANPPILLVGVPPVIVDACQAAAPDLRWLHAADAFAAGLAVQHQPGVAVLDAGALGRHHAAGLGLALRAALPEATLIAVMALDGPPPGDPGGSAPRPLWARVLSQPLEPRRLLDALEGE
jgi:excisionase family DNA binding protein